MPWQWQDSRRRSTLPPNWTSEIRSAIHDRDGGRCTWITDLDDGGPHAYLAGNYDQTNAAHTRATTLTTSATQKTTNWTTSASSAAGTTTAAAARQPGKTPVQ